MSGTLIGLRSLVEFTTRHGVLFEPHAAGRSIKDLRRSLAIRWP
ncbi:hypothetical protein RISK_001338 [Rhodopirellula islandica]|uniref:Uncharacterized protein n=1 Tax=Rhodopirellula islandica TaxID=595434 RepID=A0A0J1BJI6_RHOIS|nr:hypothetical protein RISK_001338 [Rhodopirellula islandica]